MRSTVCAVVYTDMKEVRLFYEAALRQTGLQVKLTNLFFVLHTAQPGAKKLKSLLTRTFVCGTITPAQNRSCDEQV